MSVRPINYYYVCNGSPDWAALRELFKDHVSKHNVPFFEAGSSLELRFLDECGRQGLTVESRRIIEYDGQGGDCEFLYFMVKGDKGACVEPTAEFIDQSRACRGGGSFGSCGRGAKQVSKVTVTAPCLAEIGRKDILRCEIPALPPIYLVSERLARLLENAHATGYEVQDCNVRVSDGKTEVAACKQLSFTVETAGPARLGHVKLGPRCPVCGGIKGFLSSRERFFHPNDLMRTDFQICTRYHGENVGVFTIAAGFPTISKRILDLFLQTRVRGLDRYSSDPPIEHAVVQIEDF